MNNKAKFENFLESLKGNGQDTLVESVKQGFQVCFEASEHEICQQCDRNWLKTTKEKEQRHCNQCDREHRKSMSHKPIKKEDDGWDATEALHDEKLRRQQSQY